MKLPSRLAVRCAATLVFLLVLGERLALAALPAIADGQPLPSLAPMLDQVTPAVVNIATEGHVELRTNPLFNDPFFRRFFNFPERALRRKTQSLGSGVIVDAARGLILTNNHVIANADAITVNLRDGRDFAAELVGSDPDTDVAVIRIPPERLTAVKLADSDALRVGDFVVAIGNPFGLGQTVTSGIISALARSGLGITGYEDLIQTDASINPGNSGGALVNLRGELVGINTAIYSQSGGNIGIGFAIPANMAHDVMEQLVSFGEVRRGFLGTQFQDLNAELVEAFDLPVSEGAVLASVAPGSPAAKAGLRPGDVIVEFNGRKVASAADLRNQIGLARVGAKVAVTYVREGRQQHGTVEIGARDELAGRNAGVRNERLSNVTIGDIPENSPAYGRIAGVMIHGIEPGSRAWAAGLREGDIISSVNRVPTPSVAAFVQVVDGIQGQLLLSVHRGAQAAYVVIK
ncbi:MAG: DegQ family serine endoprotease [Gammaproteobacteria bacterium]